MNPFTVQTLRHALRLPTRSNGRSIVKALSQMLHDGRPNPFWSLLMPGTHHDYQKDVGDGTRSSVLAAPLLFLMRNFPDAPPLVEMRESGQWTGKPDHDLMRLLERPNDFYDGRILWMATVMDFAFWGEAFWLKIRDQERKLQQLWWVPRHTMEPKWPDDGKKYISHYEYRPKAGPGPLGAFYSERMTVTGGSGGDFEKIPVEDVVHFKFGLDPANPRRGYCPVTALWREVATDDQAANFTATILRNLGIIGVLISPKELGTASPESVQEVKEYIQQRFTGDKRGEPLVLGQPTDVNVMQYNLQGFDVSPIRDLSEERVCAAFGLPAAVVGFGTGLQQTKVGAPQPLSARLWQPSGPTTMGEVNVGDVVSTPSGWQQVQAVYPQGEQDIYRVTFQDGSTAESTFDHLWAIRTPNVGDEVLPLSKIVDFPRWKLRHATVPLQGVTEFAERPTLIPPYVMGLLLADGSFRANLFFANWDQEIVERVRADVADGYDLTETQPHNYLLSYRKHWRGRGAGNGSGDINPFKDEIRRLGLWNLYSHQKFIPALYRYNSSRVRRELLRGLLDGDGYVNLHGQPALDQTSERLAQDVTEMVQSLGGYTLQTVKSADRRLRFIQGHPMRSRHDRYHLSIVVDDARSLFRCSAKRDRCRRRKKPPTRKFRSIEFVRREQAQCISVPGGLYLTDNFITTHNTMSELRKLAWTGCIIPMQKIIAGTARWALIPEFNPKTYRYRIRFDLSEVPALMEDVETKHDRIRKDVLAGILRVDRAQDAMGYEVDEDRAVYLQPVNLVQLGDGSVAPMAAAPGGGQQQEGEGASAAAE